jgi:hypothetical protein
MSPAVVKRRNEQENDRGQSSDPEEPARGHGLKLAWHLLKPGSEQEWVRISVGVNRQRGRDFRMSVEQFWIPQQLAQNDSSRGSTFGQVLEGGNLCNRVV